MTSNLYAPFHSETASDVIKIEAMKFALTILILMGSLTIKLFGQSGTIDSINFDDHSRFEKKIHKNSNHQIDSIEYREKNGEMEKIEIYDIRQRIKKVQIWKGKLLREIEYTYVEDDQIIKRYDTIQQQDLPIQMKLNMQYPPLALEYQIEGIVEIALDYDEKCVPRSYQVLNKLGYGIDEELKKEMDLLIKLSDKYHVPFDACHDVGGNIKISFKLE